MPLFNPLIFIAILFIAVRYAPPRIMVILASITGIVSSFIFLVYISALNTAGDGPPSSDKTILYYFWLGILISMCSYAAMLTSLRFHQKILSGLIFFLILIVTFSTYFIGELKVIVSTIYILLCMPWLNYYFQYRHNKSKAFACLLSFSALPFSVFFMSVTSSYMDHHANIRKAAEKMEREKIQEEEINYHSKFVKDFLPLIEVIKAFHAENKCISKDDLLFSDKIMTIRSVSYIRNISFSFSLERIADYCSSDPSCKNLNLHWENDSNDEWAKNTDYERRGFLHSPEGTKLNAKVIARIEPGETLVELTDGCYDITTFKMILFINPKKKKNTTVEFWLGRDGSILCGEKLRDRNNIPIKLHTCL